VRVRLLKGPTTLACALSGMGRRGERCSDFETS
jgi:hypothetical protein